MNLHCTHYSYSTAALLEDKVCVKKTIEKTHRANHGPQFIEGTKKVMGNLTVFLDDNGAALVK